MTTLSSLEAQCHALLYRRGYRPNPCDASHSVRYLRMLSTNVTLDIATTMAMPFPESRSPRSSLGFRIRSDPVARQ